MNIFQMKKTTMKNEEEIKMEYIRDEIVYISSIISACQQYFWA